MRIGSREFSPGIWPSLAVIALLPLLLWLGTWQLGRAAEKAALEGMYVLREKGPVLGIGDTLQLDLEQAQYNRVQVSGRYDGDHQFLLDNRTHRGAAGYHVLTVLDPGMDGRRLVVNRGWVPVGASRAVLPPIPVPGARLTIVGKAAPPPGVGLVLGEPGYGGDTWPRVVQIVDLAALGEAIDAPLLPYVLQLDSGAPYGFTRDWRAHHGLSPDRHRGYALQWYSLALALVVIYVVVNTRRSREA